MPRLESLEDVKLWIAEHAGQSKALWRAQHELNDKMDTWTMRIELRITALERRVMWITGMAAAVGAVLGSFGKALFAP